MGRFFPFRRPQRGMPICLRGLARGLAKMDAALSGMSFENGRVEWSANDVPHLVYGDDGRGSFPGGATASRYPFGPEYPFGISIDGAVVTVYSQIVYRGGVPLKLAESTVTITADYDWAVLKIVPAASEGEDTLSLVRMADDGGYPPDDDQGNGWILRGLHQFRLVAGDASWHKAGWVGADLGMMGY